MTERRLQGREAKLYAVAAIAAIYLVAWSGIAPELLAAAPAVVQTAAPAPAIHRVAPARTIRVRTRSS
ncbi:MAG: hypothetical protein ACM31C_12980 [Acidobacteriota bacterium]